MWKKVSLVVAALAVSSLALVAINFDLASASSLQDGVNATRVDGMPTELFGADGMITVITNVLLFVAGALAVVMIIVGGLRYVISGGNSATVTAAKNTVMYAVVGLIIAFLAFAAVNFLLDALAPGSQAGWSNQ